MSVHENLLKLGGFDPGDVVTLSGNPGTNDMVNIEVWG